MTASDAPVVTYGASTHAVRGDYHDMRPDYTVTQNYAAYGEAEQDRWRRLYARQMRLVPGRACPEFLRVIETLGYETGIPRFDEVSERLWRATQWRVVAVPGLLPEHVFFGHLAERRFPVTVWLREEAEFTYIVEPDIFHDFFGHVPLLFDPVFADYMQAYGKGGLKADGLHALEYLARLYWYTVEFGLVRTGAGLRIYGAGILSSPGEVEYAVESREPRRIGFDLRRVMRTRYKIDTYQQTYFVIEDFAQLFRETAPDFTPLYTEIAAQPQLEANALLPGDRVFA
jgi:phenylalanine-4-hydroxylase